MSFLAGVFIDLDHLIDYFINCGLKVNVKDFYDYCIKVKYTRLSLIFHSYEFIAILWALINILALNDLWKSLAIGSTQHIILDHVKNVSRNRMDWRTYFFIFRLTNRFRTDRFFKKR